jgi:NADPH2:quinone reductase
MRAIVCTEWGGPDLLQLQTLPDPTPAPHEVVIKIAAAGVNFPDVIIIQKKYQVQPALPFIPGAECAGEIIAIGSAVTSLAVGDKVVTICTTGAFAEQIAIDAAKCIKLVASADLKIAAATLLAYGTSFHALLDRAALQSHETLLVLGATGGVGLAAIEIARAIGVQKIIAAASTDAKCALASEYGAHDTINYTTEDLRTAIKRTCGVPDVIFDPVGDKFSEPAFRSIAWRGRHLVIGFAAGDIPAIPLNLTLLKGASIVGVFWGDHVKREPALWSQSVATLFDWIERGKLRPLISQTYNLAQVPDALRAMSARTVTGKIVITP